MVDTGAMLVDSPRFNRLPPKQIAERASVYFRALQAMGYAAVNVSAHEMVLGVPALNKLSRKHRVPLVSSSIVHAKTGKPVFAEHVVRQVGPLRVCFFGVLDKAPDRYGELFVEQGYEVIDPVQAARNARSSLAGKRCDMVVALSQLHRANVDLVADKVKGIDIIAGSLSQGLSMSLERLGDTYFGDCFNKGKYVAELLVTPGTKTDEFAVANLRASLQGERTTLAGRVRDISEQLKEADEPGGAVQLTEDSRRILQQQLAGLRAKLQRVTMDLSGDGDGPGDKSLLSLHLHALASDTQDDPAVLKYLDRYKKKWKVGPPGH